ncbi:M12 family metallo-peptidase [Variovorax rhizosphaerae]|uniref:M12 family metallo-peptidase n=1 Tax=Variovorax rhizosphaerae TaxID=1836200 RepID=A0ABU8WMH3_9BURK
MDDITTLRVLIVATKDAVQKYIPDLQAQAQLVIAQANQSFTNSNVKIKFELAGTWVDPDYVEDKTFSTILFDLRTKGDGKLDGVHTQRAATNANLVQLWANNNGYCGQAYLAAQSGAAAFSVVWAACASNGSTATHEIGHNLGANHDTAEAKEGSYAYGYNYNGKWSTLEAGAPNIRLNYWSNPDIFYDGIPMGTPTRNNARVLNESRFKAATFR